MPTNVSTPIWRCDLCGTTFGENLDRAELCESAPLPSQLPEGTPLLRLDKEGFRLVPLEPTDSVETDARYHATSGHHRVYRIGGGQFGHVSDRELTPAVEGYLQVRRGNAGYHGGAVSRDAPQPERDARAFAAMLGLGAPDSAAIEGTAPARLDWHTYRPHARPLTPEVKAVYDLLGVTLGDPDWRKSGYEDASILLDVADGSLTLAQALAVTSSVEDARARVHEERTRWLAGEQVEPLAPRDLAASSKLTASKLNKDQKALVAATGIAWPPRWDATDYANLILKELTMADSREREDMRLFPGPKLIAVGGIKGGVGKSTVAAALASRLAANGHRTTLVELDMDSPTQHTLWDLPRSIPLSEDRTRLLPVPTRQPDLRAFTAGLLDLTGSDSPALWSEPAKVKWTEFIGGALDVSDDEYVVLDLAAGLNPIQQLIHQYALRSSVFVTVTTARPAALAAARTSLQHPLHTDHKDIVIENLSTATGPTADGGEATIRLFGDGTEVPALAAERNAAYGGSLPWADGIPELADTPEIAGLASLVTDLA